MTFNLPRISDKRFSLSHKVNCKFRFYGKYVHLITWNHMLWDSLCCTHIEFGFHEFLLAWTLLVWCDKCHTWRRIHFFDTQHLIQSSHVLMTKKISCFWHVSRVSVCRLLEVIVLWQQFNQLVWFAIPFDKTISHLTPFRSMTMLQFAISHSDEESEQQLKDNLLPRFLPF